MKESKFIELLNLYVDHQISSEDAALLEAEIQQNAKRRQIYREYCQMQKACATLAETFRSEAPAATGRIVEFAPERRSWNVATYAMGALAAAACIALVVVNRHRLLPANAAPAETFASADIPAPGTPVSAGVSERVSAPVSARPALQPAFAGLAKENAELAATAANAERPPLDWVHQVNLEPVTTETLWFATRPTIQSESIQLNTRLGPSNDHAEALPVALRFQR